VEDNKYLYDDMNAGSEVQNLVDSVVWKDYIEPIFDRLIKEQLGGKEGDRWHNGLLDTEGLSERRLREINCYKAGMIRIHQEIYEIIDRGEAAKKELQTREEFLDVPDYGDVDASA